MAIAGWYGNLLNPTVTQLTFTVATGITTDGNNNPVPSGSTQIVIPVVLSMLTAASESRAVREQFFAGDNSAGYSMRGRIADSKNPTFPAVIANQMTPVAACTLRGKPGRLRLSIPALNPYNSAVNIGQKFFGIFIPD